MKLNILCSCELTPLEWSATNPSLLVSLRLQWWLLPSGEGFASRQNVLQLDPCACLPSNIQDPHFVIILSTQAAVSMRCREFSEGHCYLWGECLSSNCPPCSMLAGTSLVLTTRIVVGGRRGWGGLSLRPKVHLTQQVDRVTQLSPAALSHTYCTV